MNSQQLALRRSNFHLGEAGVDSNPKVGCEPAMCMTPLELVDVPNLVLNNFHSAQSFRDEDGGKQLR